MNKADGSRPNARSADGEKLIKELTGSALQFLDRAIDEFRTSPKFSTIFFATAVELFLKARLMREHWSLVLEKADQSTRAKFMAGSARTVSPETAMNRLRDLVSINIPNDASAAFTQIAGHRNRMIHFVHDSDAGTEGAILQVAAEQVRGWYHLRKLLESWQADLPWLSDDLRRVQHKMKGHSEFLKAIFEHVAPGIDAARQSGRQFVACPVCRLEAAMVSPVTSKVAQIECKVCDTTDTLLTIECPDEECGAEIQLTGWWGAGQACPACAEVISSDDLASDLDRSLSGQEEASTINCALCQSQGSVVEHDDVYVCVECFGFERGVAYCDSCDELQMGGGDLKYSYQFGCEFCEGRTLPD